jgi:tRNA (guanosine-2'-O-)-methyltransferase
MLQNKDIDPEHAAQLVGYLSQFITADRFRRFNEIITNRTRHLTVVLEDIFQPHNASAVLRTCDCFGIQDVHIIENRNRYQVNPDVALGASKWLTIHKYSGGQDNTTSCLMSLKSKGYRLVATSPHKNDFTPGTLPLDHKTALVFGTELEGLSPVALSLADDYIRIPMVGFTESLNISVSAATLLYSLTTRLRESNIPWQVSYIETMEILVAWLRNSIRKSDKIIDNYLKLNKADH